MKVMVYKKDVDHFLENFKSISSLDEAGNKYYFVFEDHIRGGQWTLMFYEHGQKWTTHGKGSHYCDVAETSLTIEELKTFIYKRRKYINNVIRSMKVPVMS
ncbi:hypothetical protein [Pradoshia sp.]